MKAKDELFVIHINPARGWRGGEQQVLYLALSLKERGIDQVVVCRRGSDLEERCTREGIKTNPLFILGELDFIAAEKIARLTAGKKNVIFHAHTAAAHSLALLAKYLVPHVPLAVSRRVDFPSRGNPLSRMKYKSGKVDVYIAISENVKRILIKDGIPEEKIQIAYSGIDLKRFANLPDPQALRQEFSIEERTVVVGNVAACVDHKDQKTLIEAVRILDQELEREWAGSIRYKLIIVGDGKLRPALEKQAELAGLLNNRIFFAGFRREIPEFLNLFHIFVMSSKEEGLGTSVLDAMACGLPVAATRGGGIPEMVDDTSGGYLSPVGDAKALAESLKKLVLSEQIRRDFGNYNRDRVRGFSREATAAATIKIYHELIEKER